MTPRAATGIALLLLNLATPARAADPPAPRPNVVLAIADDWSFPHAGVYGDRVVKTPNFDRVAREGVLFTRAFCASPSCTPSRGAVLTGQAVHRLENGGNLWSVLPSKFGVYPDALERAGYAVGLTGKGWGPGTIQGSGRSRNPAGPTVRNFEAFLDRVPKGKPFCYWFGSADPHRPYEPGTGAAAGLRAADVAVPKFLPDTPGVRNDILDYYFEVQRFDRDLGALLKALDDRGLADDTLVIVTSDNGMPFPRCKANLYDSGTRMPLAMRWPRRLPKGRTTDAFAVHTDLAPTILRAAGLDPLPGTTGVSLLGVAEGASKEARPAAFFERERHANVREGNLSYPSRAVRVDRYLYIRNLRPERWPAGDPVLVHSVGPFGDVDGSPTKDLILARRADPAVAPFFKMAFAKRPAEELYDVEKDPDQVHNLIGRDDEVPSGTVGALRAALDRWMDQTEDPLARDPGTGREPFDDYPYVGPAQAAERPAAKKAR